MAVRTILFYPDPKLRTKAQRVNKIDDEIRTLVKDMLETMYEFHGMGLAATQIDVHKRVIVMDLSPDKSQQIVLINPEILEKTGEQELSEGCLSLPGGSGMVKRAKHVMVKAQDLSGKEFTINAPGDYLSACLQHEIDHLNGILYIDYLSPLKRQLLARKVKKCLRTLL